MMKSKADIQVLGVAHRAQHIVDRLFWGPAQALLHQYAALAFPRRLARELLSPFITTHPRPIERHSSHLR